MLSKFCVSLVVVTLASRPKCSTKNGLNKPLGALTVLCSIKFIQDTCNDVELSNDLNRDRSKTTEKQDVR